MAAVQDRHLGDILIDNGVITPLDLEEAFQRQRLTGDMLGRVLVSMGLCEERDIIEGLGIQQGMEPIDITKITVKEEVLHKIPADVARFYSAVPVRAENGTLVIALADPLNLGTLDDLSQIAGQPVKGAVSNNGDISDFIQKNYSDTGDSTSATLQQLIAHVGDTALTADELGTMELVADPENLSALAQEPEVIKIVNLVLLEAVQKRASDIHFEIYEDDFRIRIRVDGVLHEVVNPPRNLSVALISRVKILSNMDISERRLPQDSRIELKVGDSEIDIRVATLPTLYGENIVMRILDRTAVRIKLETLGFEADLLKKINTVIHRPNGIFLVTGPTGSGKTTTLYGCVDVLNKVDVKIITTEDPVELQLDRVVQCQVRESMGLTFARCLRAILRQDPDICMVGEIRDLETAQIAIEAALTGHVVLSTLHTNSAPETITRLLDMNVEPFLITSALEAVLAQRLLRVLCRHCREPYRPDESQMDRVGVPHKWRENPKLRFYNARGCAACDFTGYMGRTGIFEFLDVDESIQDMILNRALAFEIRDHARKYQGMQTLREQALVKCVKGITSIDELLTHTDRYD